MVSMGETGGRQEQKFLTQIYADCSRRFTQKRRRFFSAKSIFFLRKSAGNKNYSGPQLFHRSAIVHLLHRRYKSQFAGSVFSHENHALTFDAFDLARFEID